MKLVILIDSRMTRLYACVAFLLLAQTSCFAQGPGATRVGQHVPDNPSIDFAGFVQLSQELIAERARRRVPLERFLEMASDTGTIGLDARSKRAFDAVHLRGAVHLDFLDFSERKLRETIPTQDIRILIYCNNNFQPARTAQSVKILEPDGTPRTQSDDDEEIITGTTLKSPALALNIPTFINLWGYGYKNVYELADVVPLDDPRLPLEASAGADGKTKP